MTAEPEAIDEVDELTQETDEPEQSAETPEPDSSPENPEGDETPTPEPEPEGTRAEKRIATLTRQARQAERERDYYRGLVDGQKAAQPAKPEPELKEPTPPVPADFEHDFEKFAKAQNQYVADLRAYDKQVAQRESAEREQQTLQQQQVERQKAVTKWVRDGAKAHDDFDIVVRSGPLPQHVLDAAMALENGQEALYAVMSDIDKAYEFSEMTPQQAAQEMAKMTAKPGKTGTGAPPPPKPAKGGGDKAIVDEEKLSTAEAIKRDRERRRKIGLR